MMARSTTRSNQRPDTLMQDRLPPARQNPLATHGRTIHPGQSRRFGYGPTTSGLPLSTDIIRPDRQVRRTNRTGAEQPLILTIHCGTVFGLSNYPDVPAPAQFGTPKDDDISLTASSLPRWGPFFG